MRGAAGTEAEAILFGATPARDRSDAGIDLDIRFEQLRSLQNIYNSEVFDPNTSEWPVDYTEDVFFRYDLHDLFRLGEVYRERSQENSMAWHYRLAGRQIEVWFPDFPLDQVRRDDRETILIAGQGCDWLTGLRKVQELLGLERHVEAGPTE